jgi:DNA-binding XRE family transcriptional regulator
MLTADERSPAPRHFGRPRLLPLPPRLALDHPAASFADLLSHFRARLGRSQSDLGRHAGVNASYINRLESGVRRVPTADVARALAAGLELSPQETDRFL